MSTRALPIIDNGWVLSGLRVDNLRALRMDEPLELRRLMLVVGRNGIGKSTLTRVFPLLGQSTVEGSREPLLWWARGGVDFGSFDEARRRGQDEVTFGFEFHDIEDGHRLMASTTLVTDGEGSRVGCVRAWAAGNELTLSFDSAPRVLTRTDEGTKDWSEAARAQHVIPHAGTALFGGARGSRLDDAARQARRPEIKQPGGSLREWIGLIWGVEECAALVRELAERTGYIGPFRAIPERDYRYQSVAVEALDPRGENLAMFLGALEPDEFADLGDFLHRTLDFRLALDRTGGRYALRIILDGQSYNLLDVGFGYSQVLPVAVQLWASGRVLSTSRTKERLLLLAIEQPELHLHPHHQVLVARALGASAMTDEGPMQLIETHSDHIVSEIGLLVARGELDRERVGVVCVEPHPDGDGAAVRLATYDEDGVLQNWPAGFLSP